MHGDATGPSGLKRLAIAGFLDGKVERREMAGTLFAGLGIERAAILDGILSGAARRLDRWIDAL